MPKRGLVLALVAAASIGPACVGKRSTRVAGFWYSNVSYLLPSEATAKLGGPLLPPEIAAIQQVSRDEIERAFDGLQIAITDRRDAFWRVEVRQTARVSGPLPSSGEAVPLGPLGGFGEVSFLLVALKALQYAPPNTSRQAMVDGIGKGIGRVAIHELAHEILGPGVPHHDDPNSYEFPSPDRESQYYGELHWAAARPLLERALGRR